MIKGKEYPTLASQVTAPSISFIRGDEFEYFYFVTNTEMASEKMVIAYEKRGNAENYIKEAKYDMALRFEAVASWAAILAGLAGGGYPALRTIQRWCSSFGEQARRWQRSTNLGRQLGCM